MKTEHRVYYRLMNFSFGQIGFESVKTLGKVILEFLCVFVKIKVKVAELCLDFSFGPYGPKSSYSGFIHIFRNIFP